MQSVADPDLFELELESRRGKNVQALYSSNVEAKEILVNKPAVQVFSM